jgi:hypothetical protein
MTISIDKGPLDKATKVQYPQEGGAYTDCYIKLLPCVQPVAKPREKTNQIAAHDDRDQETDNKKGNAAHVVAVMIVKA